MRVLYITAIIVVVDQATKLLVKGFSLPFVDYYHAGMQLGTSIPLLGDFFRLTFIENPGMAFGIDVGGKLYLTAFSTFASIGIVYYLFKIRQEALIIRVSLAMILGGAIGNLIDRIFYGVIFGEGPLLYGKVVDFFDLDFFNISIGDFHVSRWPVFNIADAAVSLGVLFLLVFHRKFTAVEEEGMAFSTRTLSTPEPEGVGDPSSDIKDDRLTGKPS